MNSTTTMTSVWYRFRTRKTRHALVLIFMFASTAMARDHVLIVSGVGGNDDYTTLFEETAQQLADAYTPPPSPTPLSTEATSTPDSIVSAGNGNSASVTALWGSAVSRERIQQTLATIGASADPEDKLIVMLVGHGSYDGENYKFNIPGPDLTGDELKSALTGIVSDQQLIVIATSASGVLLKSLESPGRVVVTATKSGGEINAVEFPKFWADAVGTSNADYDRNEIISAAEAFRYAQVQVEGHYSERNLLASEHPRMEGEGADRFPVAQTGSLRGAGDNPAVAKLLDQRSLLESDIVALRDRKNTLPQSDYFDALEELMLKMARLQLVIDRETGWSASDG